MIPMALKFHYVFYMKASPPIRTEYCHLHPVTSVSVIDAKKVFNFKKSSSMLVSVTLFSK